MGSIFWISINPNWRRRDSNGNILSVRVTALFSGRFSGNTVDSNVFWTSKIPRPDVGISRGVNQNGPMVIIEGEE